MKRRNRISIFSLLSGILIDLALVSMGIILYSHFSVYSFGPVTLSPLVINLVGSEKLAVLIISGLPFIVGMSSLLRTLLRTTKRVSV